MFVLKETKKKKMLQNLERNIKSCIFAVTNNIIYKTIILISKTTNV